MTLLMMEGFDDGLWSSRRTAGGGVSTATGRTGSTARRFSDQNTWDNWTLNNGDFHATLIVGFAFNKIETGYLTDFCGLYADSTTTLHVSLSVTPDGALQVHRGGSGGTLLGSTNVNVINLNTWHYIELYVTLSDTAGVVKLRVDGKIPSGWTDLSSVDTKNGGTATTLETVYFIGIPAGPDFYQDDFYVCNGAGTINNDLLGDSRVDPLYPNGDGNYSQLVGSDGDSISNYLLVDEATPDTADYVGSATDGQKDTYAFGDLAASSGSVYGVMVSMHAAKSGTAAKSCRAVARQGTTDAVGDDQTLQTSYAPHDQIWELDPTDSAAWTISKVNSAEFGFEVRP